MKYNNPERWGKTMRNAKLFSKIDGKEQYSPEYKAKLKETYTYFSQNGFEITEHGLNRIVGQKSGKNKVFFTKEQLLGVLQKSFNYEQPDGKQVKFYDDIAVIQARDTGEVVSVVTRSAVRSDWRKL